MFTAFAIYTTAAGGSHHQSSAKEKNQHCFLLHFKSVQLQVHDFHRIFISNETIERKRICFFIHSVKEKCVSTFFDETRNDSF